MGVKSKLKEIRMKEHLMNITEFANYLELPIKTYHGWEREVSKPNLEVALKIAKKLNKTVEEIWFLE